MKYSARQVSQMAEMYQRSVLSLEIFESLPSSSSANDVSHAPMQRRRPVRSILSKLIVAIKTTT